MKSVANKIKIYASDKMKICLLPGTGGGEWAFKECIECGATVFGLQRVPSVARLVEYGKKALDDLRANKVSYELEQVALDIIISTGLVSNMVSAAPKYYYNSSLAHCVYYGSTVTKGGEKHLHGEIVSLGVLCLLTFGKEYEERERIAKFNLSMGLPVCFEDIEITEDDFDAMAEKAMTTTEWDFKPENAGVTKESFIQCMKETDEYGRSIKF